MRVAEVEGLQGVGGGVIELIRLWKCVEKAKTRMDERSAPTVCKNQNRKR